MLQSDGANENKQGKGPAEEKEGRSACAASGTGYSGTGVLYAPLGNYSRGSSHSLATSDASKACGH